MNKRAFRMMMLTGAAMLLTGGMAMAEEDIAANPQDDRQGTRVEEPAGNRSGAEELVFRTPERGMTLRRVLRAIGIQGVELMWNDDFRRELKKVIFEG